MFSAIYVEKEIKEHPRTLEILGRFPSLPVIDCGRYGEVFNRNAQNFRIQKQLPALILARKYGNLVLPTPEGYGFEGQGSYYFSHMMNCIYDCRYCFLQGMYRSSNTVLFVNYEDFYSDLERYIINTNNAGNYYSGYDCDSLALEPISHFCQFFLPLFRKHPNAMLEIRTKSTQVRGLLEVQALENVIVAMSFASEAATARWEHKVPSLKKRLEALVKLQNNGWPIALRFEPIIYTDTVIEEYESLFKWVFSSLNAAKIHSVSLGEFRMPTEFYKNISKLYPDEALYAQAINVQDGEVSLKDNSGGATIEKLENMLSDFISPTQYYRCA
jgi:spore photoproduct lyase|tara:strand:- start:479 stop:1465 length:987 start_codon:yes stop_codon:yes gene_type:complete